MLLNGEPEWLSWNWRPFSLGCQLLPRFACSVPSNGSSWRFYSNLVVEHRIFLFLDSPSYMWETLPHYLMTDTILPFFFQSTSSGETRPCLSSPSFSVGQPCTPPISTLQDKFQPKFLSSQKVAMVLYCKSLHQVNVIRIQQGLIL